MLKVDNTCPQTDVRGETTKISIHPELERFPTTLN